MKSEWVPEELMHRKCQNPSPTSRTVLGILVGQPHLPLLRAVALGSLFLAQPDSCLNSWGFQYTSGWSLPLLPQMTPPLAMAACSYSVTCCAPCTTPVSCQAHPLQSPPVHRAPSFWHADSTSLLTDQPRLFSPSSLLAFWYNTHAMVHLLYLLPCTHPLA